MVNEQPEALRLAEGDYDPEWLCDQSPLVAAELRRLHEAHEWQYTMAGQRLRRIEKLEASNQELLAALKALVKADAPDCIKSSIWQQAFVAINKAERTTP